jgi:hypothetical protein
VISDGGAGGGAGGWYGGGGGAGSCHGSGGGGGSGHVADDSAVLAGNMLAGLHVGVPESVPGYDGALPKDHRRKHDAGNKKSPRTFGHRVWGRGSRVIQRLQRGDNVATESASRLLDET